MDKTMGMIVGFVMVAAAAVHVLALTLEEPSSEVASDCADRKAPPGSRA
jgi:hypothetical protein